MVAAMIGVYSVPLLRRIRPELHKTSMTRVIANCTTVLVLSSALPVLARTLGLFHDICLHVITSECYLSYSLILPNAEVLFSGITTFDLVGAYGSFMWLSNFTLVWTYNVAFAFVTVSCLLNHFTTPVRKEIIQRCEDLLFAIISDFISVDFQCYEVLKFRSFFFRN